MRADVEVSSRPPGLRAMTVVAAALLLGLGLLAGYGWGASSRDVHVEDASCYSSPVQAGCTLSDGYVVGFTPSGMTWIGADGTRHDGSRPACLGGRSDDGVQATVRLHWVEVTVDGGTTREVLRVTC